ncbi:aldo/keto reductase [Pelomyxa schiedti]|nr:aldo/keto reductase [Pelomyxa schiedti]
MSTDTEAPASSTTTTTEHTSTSVVPPSAVPGEAPATAASPPPAPSSSSAAATDSAAATPIATAPPTTATASASASSATTTATAAAAPTGAYRPIHEREMIIGTWAWGADNTSSLGMPAWGTKGNSGTDNAAALRAAVARGVVAFDTAEVYNSGRSEAFIAEAVAALAKVDPAAAESIQVATKFIPMPWRFRQVNLRNALVESLGRLKRPWVDLYQVHSPAVSIRQVEVWAEALAQVQKEGLTRTVGVSNYNTDQVMRTHAALQGFGVALATNQIEYSLLHRLPEKTGLIKRCNELGVKILAYSSLAMGRLTGKYKSQAALDTISDRQFGTVTWPVLEKILQVMQRIADEQGGKTLSQVAINWVICKGCIPIVGAKNEAQAIENAGAVGWRLSAQQVADLDEVSLPGTATWWQGSTI